MATSDSMSMYLTEHELLLVRRFLSNNEGSFHLGACGRLDEHAAFEVLAKLIRRIRGVSLLQIVDSHQTEDIISEIHKLRVCHAAAGQWLDALENRLLDLTNDEDLANCSNLNSQVASGKIAATLLKSFESPDRKVRMESVDAVNKILEKATKRIQSTGTGDFFGALRGRLNDSNKNIKQRHSVGYIKMSRGQ
ncbi:Protein MICROTUBULE ORGANIZATION 1, variant 2 [Trifolium repens]|nr:Protein MICROTUBULE ORGANIZATION 1, variant 2 [Trifolium repens]